MGLRRRVAFATPFVLVACGGSSKPAVEEPDDDDEVVVAKSEPTPGLIDTSHFPLTRDPPRRDEPEPVLPCSDPRARCTHNPPPPEPKPPPIDCNELKKHPDPSNPTCNPPSPQPIRGRVIDVAVQSTGTLITIGRGSNDGLSREWSGCVLRNNSDSCAPSGDVVVVRVQQRTTYARTKLTPDQIHASGATVKLTPPK